MKHLFLMRSLLSLLTGFFLIHSATAQTATDPNEGSRLTYDRLLGSYDFSWWGQPGRTYFLQHSDDLSAWEYLPLIESGANAPLGWGFTSNASKFFLRLRYSDIPTSDPFNDDFDGDKISNNNELVLGTDPLLAADTDANGLPDDWERFYFGHTGVDPNATAPGGGMTNLQHFQLGSNPNNAPPPPTITAGTATLDQSADTLLYPADDSHLLLQNGNFSVTSLGSDDWNTFSGITGWTAISGSLIELQQIEVNTTAGAGQYCELDSHWPTENHNVASDHGIQQTANLSRGHYLLIFDYRGRYAGADSFTVKLQAGTAAPVLLAAKNGAATEWKRATASFEVTGGNPNSTTQPVTLLYDIADGTNGTNGTNGTGNPDSFGAYIDNVILIPVEIITRDPDDTNTYLSEGVVAEADPKPEVELHLDSAEFNSDGDLQVTVSGTVKDRLSEVLVDSSSRVQNLHFLVNGVDFGQTVALYYTDCDGPFKVVESETTFTQTLTITDPKPGSYMIKAETDENAAGNTGWGKVAVGINIEPTNENLPANPNQLTIAFTQAPGTTQADSAQVYFGNREPASGDGTVSETAPDNWIFSGSLMVGEQSATCTMRMRPVGVSDSVVDHLVAEVRYILPGGIEQVITGGWVETGNTTLRFYPDGYQIGGEQLVINSTQELPGSKGSSFEPLIFRTNLPDGWVQSSGFKIKINGEEHALKKFTYEGTESHYVVADGSATRPKVFIASSKTLPAEVTVPAPGADGAGIEWTMELGGQETVLGEVLVVPGAEPVAAPTASAPGLAAPPSATAGWNKPGDTITEDDLLTAYRFLYPDELSQLLLDTYRSAGHHIFLEDVYGDYKFVGYRLDQKVAIYIEDDDSDVHPGIAAQYLWMGLNKALSDYSFRAAIRDASPSIDLQISVLTAWRQQIGPAAAETGVAAAELYLSGIGIVNEPLDWVLVVNDLAEGHYTSLAAALPFIPRGLIASGKALKIKNTAGEVLETFTDAAKLDAAKGLYRESDLRVMGVTMEQHQFSRYLREVLARNGGAISPPVKHGELKKRMLAAGPKPNWGKRPPKLCKDGKYRSYDTAQAHHDFPWAEKDWFARHGLDVNNPAFGR